MDFALRLYHGKHADAATEVTEYPHLEIMATEDHERERLKVLADQLRAFGHVPFSYRELESTTGELRGALLRVALHERQESEGDILARAPSARP